MMMYYDCRGQSYAAYTQHVYGMLSICSSHQARIKSENSLAIYVPCTVHSLKLLGESAVEGCHKVTNLY